MKTQALILAAGKGTRLQSNHPKVLHCVHNKPMLHHVIQACLHAGISDICLVVGYKKEAIYSACCDYTLTFAVQDQQLGTGHAVICAIDQIQQSPSDTLLVLAGDCPLIQASTLKTLTRKHRETAAAATILTAILNHAGHYGRIIRNTSNQVTAIREAADCSETDRLIGEFNSGIYCFNKSLLIESIHDLQATNAQNEYYLTDIIHILCTKGHTVYGHCIPNAQEVLGANTKAELAQLNKTFAELSANK